MRRIGSAEISGGIARTSNGYAETSKESNGIAQRSGGKA
jgi:hypothetical protein